MISFPSILISPDVRLNSLSNCLIKVDLPLPVGPTIPIVSPLLIEKVIFFITSKTRGGK